ncbi:MAG: 50S ribosomal protein L11 [Bacillales bacterium]|nr:50S ribosomal protein L11 [Bacillales bacterium]
MSKRISRIMKLEILGGQAKPGASLAALSQAGVSMPKFCQEFNDKTKDRPGKAVPVIITAYEDKTFSIILKTTSTVSLLLEACGIKSGAKNPKTETVATISKAKVREIAEYKLPDLSANDVEAAMKTIAGTCRQMGIKVGE